MTTATLPPIEYWRDKALTWRGACELQAAKMRDRCLRDGHGWIERLESPESPTMYATCIWCDADSRNDRNP